MAYSLHLSAYIPFPYLFFSSANLLMPSCEAERTEAECSGFLLLLYLLTLSLIMTYCSTTTNVRHRTYLLAAGDGWLAVESLAAAKVKLERSSVKAWNLLIFSHFSLEKTTKQTVPGEGGRGGAKLGYDL